VQCPSSGVNHGKINHLYFNRVSQLRAVVIGTFLHLAHEEGLIRNSSIHAGIRAPLVRRKGDMRNDVRCGFETVKARDIDRIGVDGIIEKLKDRVAGTRVYVSVDIDVLDPAFAPGKPSQTIQDPSIFLISLPACRNLPLGLRP
jgi:arginase family enzyme